MSCPRRSAHTRRSSGFGTRPRRTLLVGLIAVVTAAVGVMVPASPAAASVQREPGLHQYLGVWNYDKPDPATLNNVAVLSCPSPGSGCADVPLPLPLEIPQVGNVEFTAAADGTVLGRTDQGCTWKFVVTPDSLELASTTQTCFNQNIGSSYTITRWSVTVTGNHERESIVSISHQPNGVDLIATMDSGSRTRVRGVGGFRSFSRFLGRWTYDPADFHTLRNVVSTDHGTAYPAEGTISFTSDVYGTIVAHTPDSCRWTLSVQGNTAELDPAMQTCHLAQGTVSLRYWAIATDGLHDNTFMSGSEDLNGEHTNTYLFIGSLTKA